MLRRGRGEAALIDPTVRNYLGGKQHVLFCSQRKGEGRGGTKGDGECCFLLVEARGGRKKDRGKIGVVDKEIIRPCMPVLQFVIFAQCSRCPTVGQG